MEFKPALLDRAGRLWLGADRGEWVGLVSQVDLIAGTVAEIKSPITVNPRKAFWEGVYGFLELDDGQIWAYGGTSHMGFNSCEIVRIDTLVTRSIYRNAVLFSFDKAPGPDPHSDRPRLPITHVVQETGGALVVFSYNDVFRVDRTLTSWKRAATLKLKYRWGRPDAVGSYPSVRVIHRPEREGEPYLLATALDGYLSLEGAKAVPRGVSGQLGASVVGRVESSSEGVLAFDSRDGRPPWKRRDDDWESVPLAPPYQVEPMSEIAEFELEEKDWFETPRLGGTRRCDFHREPDRHVPWDADHGVLGRWQITATGA